MLSAKDKETPSTILGAPPVNVILVVVAALTLSLKSVTARVKAIVFPYYVFNLVFTNNDFYNSFVAAKIF